MRLQNCWEYKKCGREPDGHNTDELGVCPATVEEKADGINDGTNGGRACWAIVGTICKGTVQGTYALKILNCLKCDFYKKVLTEESWGFKSGDEILKIINSKT
ncbi:MAG: hypothetical protein JSW20_08890 [Nitrospiraceae bacterium]|nr:MAG: hypothetical protein JSW20_08890 [Nitrospiraceae bacterium]